MKSSPSKAKPVLSHLFGLFAESRNFASFSDSLAGLHVSCMSDLSDANKDFITDSLQASFIGFIMEAGGLLKNDYLIEPFINVNFGSAVCSPKFVPIVLTVMLQDVRHLDIDHIAVFLTFNKDGVLIASCG